MNGTLPFSVMKPLFSQRYVALWVACIVNLTLFVLYLWSRGGGTVHVQIINEGSRYTAIVDGREIYSTSFPGSGLGRLAFGIQEEGVIPALPQPAGIDIVRITDDTSGEVVFEDAFERWQPELWSLQAGDEQVGDGVFATGPSYALVTTQIEEWDTHSVDAIFRNLTQVAITVGKGTDAMVLRIWPFARYDSRVDRLAGGVVLDQESGARLELDREQTLKSITAMLLRPYPVVLAIAAAVTALAFAFRIPSLERKLQAAGQFVLSHAYLLMLGVSLGALTLLWYLIYVVGDAMPHVPDSVAYVFQAKLFSSFRVAADVPPVLRSFSFSSPSPIQAVDGRWFSQYPFGHPLFLSIGQLFGVIWLVPPVLGAACIFLIYRVGHHVYGSPVGVLAALLLLFSPFFQMTASNFMSHNTAVFVILLCLFLYVRPTKRRVVSMLLSGALLGLLFNIRPLAAVAFMPALAGLFAYDMLKTTKDNLQALREYAAFAAGSVLLLLAYFLYNQITTGDPFTSGYALTNTYAGDSFGFGGEHSVALGLQNLQQLLAFMLLVANGWPAAIGLMLAALPFILGTRRSWDYFLAASVLSLAVAIIFYRNAAVMHGPRFWYETMPFLMLLMARGVHRLWEVSIATSDWLTTRLGRTPQVAPKGLVGAVLLGLVAMLIAFSAYGWMFGARDAWSGLPAVPQRMSLLEGFNFADRRLLDEADEMDIKNALILVEDCTHWWCYGSVFWTNSPDLDGDIVWAERSPFDSFLLEAFKGRDLFLADYGSGVIRTTTAAEILAESRLP